MVLNSKKSKGQERERERERERENKRDPYYTLAACRDEASPLEGKPPSSYCCTGMTGREVGRDSDLSLGLLAVS